MPKVIEELAKRQGRPPVYPWDAWLDGQAREFTKGNDDEVEKGDADFSSKVESFVSQARRQAEQRNMSLNARTIDETTVQIQAVPQGTLSEDEVEVTDGESATEAA